MNRLVVFVFFISLAVFLFGLILPFLAQYFEKKLASRTTGASSRLVEGSLEVIIPAYLEAGVVPETIARLRDQLRSWPHACSITVVASDHATVLAAVTADKVLVGEPRGKPTAVNQGIENSVSTYIVLTDANCEIYPQDWPIYLKAALKDSSLISAQKEEISSREGLFWQYENRIKKRSTTAVGTLSVIGEFMAFRRADFRPIPARIQSDDLWMAMDFNQQGLTVALSLDISTTEIPASPSEQWERRVRIAAGQLGEALPQWKLLARSSAGRLYMAHKLYRLTLGPLGFWTAAICFGLLWTPVTLPVVILVVGFSLLSYLGKIERKTPLDPIFTVVALQTIPVMGVLRVWNRWWMRRNGKRTEGWIKIAR
ncbi:glycosyltransferase [Cryobacterium serini]|uniref:glycosyltransferase n=1 Tax=Cryobacterium serini TaxID=1259201 RepID=UPI00141B7CC5|nr:glycosyltransferase [Cryobacterium serini]